MAEFKALGMHQGEQGASQLTLNHINTPNFQGGAFRDQSCSFLGACPIPSTTTSPHTGGAARLGNQEQGFGRCQERQLPVTLELLLQAIPQPQPPFLHAYGLWEPDPGLSHDPSRP